MAFAIQQPPEAVTNFTLQFVLLVRDGFADSDQLRGEVTVTAGTIKVTRRDSNGSFLFYKLKPGAQSLAVESGLNTPYYLPTKTAVMVPVPQPAPPAPQYPWPVFPDVRLADPSLPLGDAGQKAAYKQQRAAATLFPSPAYPFPEGTTLIRGTVSHGNTKVAGATVQRAGSTDPAFTTGPDGEFVLYWQDAPGVSQNVTLNAKAPGLADQNPTVTVMRGLAVSISIVM